MIKKTKILSDFSKIASDAFGTFSGVKNEIETIAKIKIEKIINKADLVRRQEFEVLKIMVRKLSKKNNDLEKELKSLKKKNSYRLKKTLKKPKL